MREPLGIMADLLLELEQELRALQLWTSEKPTRAMLASTAPFAADRLSLEQWLQWIFIPRIKQLIEANAELPTSCNIYPYAEECLGKDNQSAGSLLGILSRIDRHISAD